MGGWGFSPRRHSGILSLGIHKAGSVAGSRPGACRRDSVGLPPQILLREFSREDLVVSHSISLELQQPFLYGRACGIGTSQDF